MASNFLNKSLSISSDPIFLRYKNIIEEPNIFKIVGQTNYERWHSSFWGWLLDPHGSHSLKYYSLNKLLITLLDDKCIKPKDNSVENLNSILTTIEFLNIGVKPNEIDSRERSISDGKRLDIWISGEISFKDKIDKKINIIVEMKVGTKTRGDQSKSYADWLNKNHSNDINYLIYIVPSDRLRSSPEATTGDERWFCIDFQLLHDKVLLPVIEHPDLNEKVKPFIVQYIKNLKIPYKGLKMAITDEERQIARDLYDRYSDVFDSIYETLQYDNIGGYDTQEINKASNRSYGNISVKIENKIFEGSSVKELFGAVLKDIVESGKVEKLVLPWGTGRSRYIVTNDSDPKHPNGKDFFVPVTYNGYTLEAHVSRNGGIRILENLCKELDLKFELIEA
jgi:hypothetical protein